MAFRREDERSVGGGVQAVRSGDRRLRDRASVRSVRLEEAERGFAQPQERTGVEARQIVEQPVAPVDGLAAFDDDRAVRADAVLERRGIVLVECGENAPQYGREAFQRLGGRRCAVCRCRAGRGRGLVLDAPSARLPAGGSGSVRLGARRGDRRRRRLLSEDSTRSRERLPSATACTKRWARSSASGTTWSTV